MTKTSFELAIEKDTGKTVKEIRESPLEKPKYIGVGRFHPGIRYLTREAIEIMLDKALE